MLPAEPVYELRLPRSAAMLALAAVAKGPLEQVLDAYQALHAQIVLNEERIRAEERDALLREAMKPKGPPHGPDGVR